MWLVRLESGHLLSRKLVVKVGGRAAGRFPGAIPVLSLTRGFLAGPRKSSLGSAQGWSEVSEPGSAYDRFFSGSS